LKSTTVKFFSDGGYSVKLMGAKQVGDYLQASGLVTAAEIQAIQAKLQPGQSLCQVLADQGLLQQVTADYFTRNFAQQSGPRSLRDIDFEE
jgi:hypothetical protein